jgi:S1-C subfamily serine protease
MTRTLSQLGIGAAALLGLLAAPAPPAAAQQRDRVAKDDAALVVDGVVRQVFRSPRQGQTDYLVQIEVQRSEGRHPLKGTARPPFPAPGDVVYVHVFQRQDATGRGAADGGYGAPPAERTQVRAYLTPREQGGWEGTFPEWFDVTADRRADAGPADPAPSAPEAPKDRSALGLTTEAIRVQGQTALKVTSVERGGPAQRAGLEVGDVIIGAKGAPLTGPDQIEALARGGAAFPLIVLDVHTGRTAQVEVRPGTPVAADTPKPTGEAQPTPAPTTTPAPAPTPAPAGRSLGIAAEPVTVGQRTALKVTRVEPDSPAAKAGVEPGDVLVAANGAALTGPEQLAAALRKSGPTLILTVRDVRTGRDTPVTVAFGGPEPANPLPTQPAPGGPGSASGGGKLGAVTELAFYDVEAAVKVTEVEPGSPADRAGLQPGTLILAANGKAILHPTELTNAVRNSGGTLKLTVVDPRTGRKGTVDVNLDGGG